MQQAAVKSAEGQENLREPAGSRAAVADSTIRVDVGLLDKLMNLVGELVLARNQILQFAATQEDSAFVATSQRLNLITTELQEGVMKTRMQPIGNVWNRVPARRARPGRGLRQAGPPRDGRRGDRARQDHHRGDQGSADPLVRNAVDHGIETPEDRVRRREAGRGPPLLRAFHEGGQVNIEISRRRRRHRTRSGSATRPCSGASSPPSRPRA